MKNKPQLVILGGINGAGKSSTRDRYLMPDESNVVVIDPDRLSKFTESKVWISVVQICKVAVWLSLCLSRQLKIKKIFF